MSRSKRSRPLFTQRRAGLDESLSQREKSALSFSGKMPTSTLAGVPIPHGWWLDTRRKNPATAAVVFRIPHPVSRSKKRGLCRKMDSIGKSHTGKREKTAHTKKAHKYPAGGRMGHGHSRNQPAQESELRRFLRRGKQDTKKKGGQQHQPKKRESTTRNSGIPPNSAHFRKNREIARFCRNVWYYLRKSRIPEFRRIPFQCRFSPMPRQRFFANLLFFPPAPRCVPLRFSVTGRVIINLRIPSLKHGSHKILEIPNSGIPV